MPPAVAGMTAQPLVITQGEPAGGIDKINHAKSRLDAIKRSLDQHGHLLEDTRKGEFRSEVRDHVHTLIQAGIMTDDDGAALVKTGGA